MQLKHFMLNRHRYTNKYNIDYFSDDDEDDCEEDKQRSILKPFILLLSFVFLYLLLLIMMIKNSANSKHEESKLQSIPSEFYQRFALDTNRSLIDNVEIPVASQLYNYPSMLDMLDLVERIKTNRTVPVAQLNQPVDWIINNFHLCRSSTTEKLELFILVRSNSAHLENRQAIRNTWGRRECYFGSYGTVRRLFIMEAPAPNNSNLESESLRKEAKLYHDMAVMQFHVPDNMQRTRILVASLDWITSFCTRARHVLIVDDNYFVQPGRIAHLLRIISDSVRSRLVAGYVVNYELPVRYSRNGVSISRQIYPDMLYPPYLGNGVMLLAREMATDLAIAAHYVKLFPLEEIFLALVMNKLLLMPLHLEQFLAKPQRQDLPAVFSDDIRFRQILLSHGYEKSQSIRLAWEHQNAQRGYCL